MKFDYFTEICFCYQEQGFLSKELLELDFTGIMTTVEIMHMYRTVGMILNTELLKKTESGGTE